MKPQSRKTTLAVLAATTTCAHESLLAVAQAYEIDLTTLRRALRRAGFAGRTEVGRPRLPPGVKGAYPRRRKARTL